MLRNMLLVIAAVCTATLGVVLLRNHSEQIKLAVAAILAAVSHITANDWANYVTIAYGIAQVADFIYTRLKNHGTSGTK